MVTDLAEVFRLGTEKAQENVNFRRYLSAHHLPTSPFQILATEVQRHIDCTACANCCRYSIVPVTAVEIEAIAAHVGATVKAATSQYTDSGNLRSSPAGCVFLDGNLCLIYEARPGTCRDFPHITPGINTLGARHSSHARWAALCPIIYNALEAHKHLAGYHPQSPGASEFRSFGDSLRNP